MSRYERQLPIGSNSYSDTGLTPGVNHSYTVSAVDAAGNGSALSGAWSGAAADDSMTVTYTYDAENRLTQLATNSSVDGSYAYDGAGDRISKTTATGTTTYTLDLASKLPQVLSETKGSSTYSYAYAGGALELDQSGTTYWYLDDTLGSVRYLSDESGEAPASYSYLAFGASRTSTGSVTNEVRFAGERTDTESGLEYLRARTYDPATGTFLQRDSWGISPTDDQSLDLYLYTENDPADDVDPSGHCFIACISLPSLPIPDVSAVAHTALGAASFVPVVGSAAAVADAGLYAYEGDYLNAGLSLTGVVPGGAVLSAGSKAISMIRRADSAIKVVSELEKPLMVADKAESGFNKAVSYARPSGFRSGSTTRFGPIQSKGPRDAFVTQLLDASWQRISRGRWAIGRGTNSRS